MPNVFEDVQSGSSSTASAEAFVEQYGDTPILGGEWWFNYTLFDYVHDRGVGWPPYGVIVRPVGKDMLVWFDASNRLHVIDLSITPNGNDVSKAVQQPEYFEDPQYLELWRKTLKPLIPTVFDIKTILMLVLGIGIVAMVGRR